MRLLDPNGRDCIAFRSTTPPTLFMAPSHPIEVPSDGRLDIPLPATAELSIWRDKAWCRPRYEISLTLRQARETLIVPELPASPDPVALRTLLGF